MCQIIASFEKEIVTFFCNILFLTKRKNFVSLFLLINHYGENTRKIGSLDNSGIQFKNKRSSPIWRACMRLELGHANVDGMSVSSIIFPKLSNLSVERDVHA